MTPAIQVDCTWRWGLKGIAKSQGGSYGGLQSNGTGVLMGDEHTDIQGKPGKDRERRRASTS